MKLYKIEKNNIGDKPYSLSVSTNGYQWLEVYAGELEDCLTVSVGYRAIGYTLWSRPVVQILGKELAK